MAENKLSKKLEDMTIDELFAVRKSLIDAKQKLSALLKKVEGLDEKGRENEA